MTRNRSFALQCASLLSTIVILSSYTTAQSKNDKYACSEANPAQLCSAANTCGSASAPCSVDVQRTAYAASATPSIPGAKGNSLFCLKAGTTVQWKSTRKNVGFVVDVGNGTPFATAGPIIGGTERTISVVAKTPGCYKYSAGACVSGSLSGMCGEGNAEFVIVP
jgi:plastocyanin